MADPSALTATASGSTSIGLTWNSGSGWTRILIERKPDGGSYSQIANVFYTTTSYTSSGLSGGVKYYFRIRGYTDPDYSDYSTAAYATTTLQAPSSCVATAASSTSVTITWSDNSSTETSFEIYMNGALTYSPVADAESYTKTGLTAGSTYSFKVRAKNSAATSSFSNTDTITLLTAPTAPSGLTATANGKYQIDLAWTDNSDNETRFVVWRMKEGEEVYTSVETTAANVEAWSDTSCEPGTLYYYKVRAGNAAGSSAYTNVASATTEEAGDPVTVSNTGQQNIVLIDTFDITVTDPVSENDVIGTDGYTFKLGDYDSDNGYPITAYFRTKDMDFADQHAELQGMLKTIRRFRLLYEDVDSTTPTTVYISNDGGVNWGSASADLGTGTGAIAAYDFWFQTSPYATGLNFTFKIESLSSSTNFKWVGFEIEFLIRGEHFNL